MVCSLRLCTSYSSRKKRKFYLYWMMINDMIYYEDLFIYLFVYWTIFIILAFIVCISPFKTLRERKSTRWPKWLSNARQVCFVVITQGVHFFIFVTMTQLSVLFFSSKIIDIQRQTFYVDQMWPNWKWLWLICADMAHYERT